MLTIGELIRSIRLDKGMSQQEAARGILSRSHLSELEHNNYYPSYDKMIRLIHRLGISLTEFESELHSGECFSEDYYIRRTNDLSTESKVDELARFLRTEFTERVAGQSLRLKHKRLNMLGLVDFIQHHGCIEYEKYQPLFTYLLECQNWRKYELSLLSNAIFLARYPVAKVLARQFMSKFQCSELNASEYKIPVFFNNLSEMALINQEFKSAITYGKLSQKYAAKNHNLYDQIIGKIMEYMANYLSGDPALAEIENLLHLFISLNYPETANYYSNLCKRLGIELNCPRFTTAGKRL